MKHKCLFRKFVAIIVVLATMLPVFACTPRQQVEATPQPSAVVETSEPNFTPYKGDRSEYVSIYTDERDKACEADIVKFADTFLDPYNGHAKLTDKDSTVWLYTNPSSYETVYENFYDAELRTEFLKKINELIISVPKLTEFEIIAGLAETLALLKEGHSTINMPSEKRFPLSCTLMFNENGMELYVERATDSYNDCLAARLDAINGVSANEIIERIRRFINCESDMRAYAQAAYYATICSIMNYVGVIDDTDSAIFSFTDALGKSFEKKIQAVDNDEEVNSEMINYLFMLSDAKGEDLLINTRYLDNYEYRYLKDETVLYIRIKKCTFDGRDIINQVFEKIHAENKDVESIIIDFRRNGGGSVDYLPSFIAQLREFDESIEKYILIDEGVFSGGIISAACIRRAFDNATIVGTPGGSPVSEIFGIYLDSAKLPNLGTEYHCGRYPCSNCWPGYEHDVLTPDKIIYQTYEDYLNGVDTVMKALLSE